MEQKPQNDGWAVGIAVIIWVGVVAGLTALNPALGFFGLLGLFGLMR